jgi:hypothetical protein
LDGTVTVEPRRQNLFLSHELVFTFSERLTSGSALVSKQQGISTSEIRGDELVIHLWRVKDGETISLTLKDVSDGKTVLAPVRVKVGFLFGDVLGSGAVDNSDVNEVRNDAVGGGKLDSETFRADILLNGKINQSDILFDQLSIGHQLND